MWVRGPHVVGREAGGAHSRDKHAADHLSIIRRHRALCVAMCHT